MIDATAAPGMKTSSLAALLRGTGHVFAFDKDAHRIKLMRQQLKRYGAHSITSHHPLPFFFVCSVFFVPGARFGLLFGEFTNVVPKVETVSHF